jgi:hypothetical protein
MSGVVHQLVPNEWTNVKDSATQAWQSGPHPPTYPIGPSTRRYRCLQCGDTYDARVKQPSCKIELINEVEDAVERLSQRVNSLIPEGSERSERRVEYTEAMVEAELKKLKWQKWKRQWAMSLWKAWVNWRAVLHDRPWSGKTIDQLVAEEKAAKRKSGRPKTTARAEGEMAGPAEGSSKNGSTRPPTAAALFKQAWASQGTGLTRAMKRRKRLGLLPVGYVAPPKAEG